MNKDFEMVQATNDPNTLAVFLGHSHYHVEGLLTLAMVFAHTGTPSVLLTAQMP